MCAVVSVVLVDPCILKLLPRHIHLSIFILLRHFIKAETHNMGFLKLTCKIKATSKRTSSMASGCSISSLALQLQCASVNCGLPIVHRIHVEWSSIRSTTSEQHLTTPPPREVEPTRVILERIDSQHPGR